MSKLALILVAFVSVIAGVDAYAGDTPPKEPYRGWNGPPPVNESKGAKEKDCPPKAPGGGRYLVACGPLFPTKKETPKKSAPPAPAETAKALNPTKKAAPDPSEHADKASQ
jgi:hypothetical protein